LYFLKTGLNNWPREQKKNHELKELFKIFKNIFIAKNMKNLMMQQKLYNFILCPVTQSSAVQHHNCHLTKQ
jgi:uncharacterized membrane protein